MTEMTEQSVTVDALRDALANAEQQLASVHERLHALEAELRGLVNTGLTDEQQGQERERIKAAYREQVEQQRTIQEWIDRLKHAIENFELRVSQPATELKRATSALAEIDERLAALTQQIKAVQGDREIALLHLATAQAAVDAVAIVMPERPLYAPPARTVAQIGASTYWVNAAGVEVRQDGSPLISESA
jgi:chromosome segregation ATPase